MYLVRIRFGIRAEYELLDGGFSIRKFYDLSFPS